ncbi:hypothetical protein QQF64_031803 [Cirrhinus molitorella]|uniref:Uncharacterized protein n=1 Tax=Cirrhinus molitorella TaxID=172907 RepID=A0ABR3MXZ6_9TELE
MMSMRETILNIGHDLNVSCVVCVLYEYGNQTLTPMDERLKSVEKRAALRRGGARPQVKISQIFSATIITAVTQELDSQKISDATKSPTPYPLFLPVTYQVWDADYFLLKEAGQDIMRNSSMQSHTQPLVVLQAGRLPVINASYGLLSTKREIPLDLVQSVQLFQTSSLVFTLNWKVQSFVLTRWVCSSSPKVRVLFYVAGRDWDRGEKDKGMKDELPCVTVYAFWQCSVIV